MVLFFFVLFFVGIVVVVVVVLLFSIVKNAVTSKNSKKISNSSKEALAAIHIKKALIDKTGTLHGMTVIEEEVSGPKGPTRGVVFRMELN